ncbi:MAG TPA: bifunctional diguanylate cyclase/phosphodiesterase [Dactylosporangium sp.]|nr:bifunctional diguanylate cyclase/phosphodiesterase [Dactylosporangium sp.]
MSQEGDGRADTGRRGEADERITAFAITQRGESDEPTFAVTQRGNGDEPQSAATQRGEADEPTSAATQRGEGDERIATFAIKQRGESDEPTSAATQRGEVEERIAAFAITWERTLPAGTSFVRGGRARRRRLLEGFAARLVAAVRAAEFDRRDGYRVGHDMVLEALADPKILLASSRLLREQLLGAVGLRDARDASRLTELLDELAHGFATAMRSQVWVAAESLGRGERTAWRAKQRDLERQVHHALMHDPLTGLPNRAALISMLGEGRHHRAARRALCIVNLRRFGAVNQLLGHDAGDRLLVGIAQRLATFADERGDELAHLGGDTFVLVMTGVSGADEAVKAADAVLRALPASWPVDGHDVPVSGRAGVVESAAGAASPDELLRQASMALDWARHDGSAWAVYNSGRATAHLRRHQRAHALPEALAAGAVTAAFQPIVRLHDHAIVGMHALPRWAHPATGPVPEAELLRLAEQSGLLVPLGHRLLAEACARAARWRLDDTGPQDRAARRLGAAGPQDRAARWQAGPGAMEDPAAQWHSDGPGDGATLWPGDAAADWRTGEAGKYLWRAGQQDTHDERAGRWQPGDGAPIVSLDVADAQLRHPDFADTVIDILRETGLAPGRLHLAVPEQALHDPTDAAAFALDGLDRAGVRIAVTQVGIGHANLTATPVHSVRLEPQLISGLDPNEPAHRSNLSMATWLISMFHDLSISVTATGVDHRGQTTALQLLDCDHGLGRALGKPMTADAADILFGLPQAN